ncbi:hypothetical protein [Permianibacter aggregans]|uniref:Pycsar effector protein domain-containing protein n=1 Tax=Permianibacter aggregans TaxID=1510150 RepID=A0A4R6UJX7_9GAMM|nr:hypothetical protein [Permianibacter aggregans]QGX39730.1 hypothetical protein E2H98_08705 [Permianibacter aggregans]TDQ47151.1 hypothetical protein EV696_11179 [Permianibacter aggregans]
MEESRFEYCRYIYDREFELKQRLENKASAVFAIPSAIISATFLNIDLMTGISHLIKEAQPFVLIALVFFIVLFSVSTFTSVFFSLASILIQDYAKEYPEKIHDYLFNPKSSHYSDSTAFFREVSARLAMATQHNSLVNKRKAKKLSVSAWSLVSMLLSLAIFLVIYILAGAY